MFPGLWLVVAVLAAILVTMWVTFTLTRLDRLHARVDAAFATMDAQLVRRAAALQHVAESPDMPFAAPERARLHDVALVALNADSDDRQLAENTVGRELTLLVTDDVALPAAAAAELKEVAVRVFIARRFYNDAVRDTRSLRARRMPRWLHLAGHRELPQFFDIDDTVPDPHPNNAAQT